MDVGQYRKLGCSQCLEGVGLDFDFSVMLFQGYYFARPGFRCLPEVDPACF